MQSVMAEKTEDQGGDERVSKSTLDINQFIILYVHESLQFDIKKKGGAIHLIWKIDPKRFDEVEIKKNQLKT